MSVRDLCDVAEFRLLTIYGPERREELNRLLYEPIVIDPDAALRRVLGV